MPERAASEVCADGHRIQFEELVKGVDCVVRRFSDDWWDCGGFEALDKIVDGVVCHEAQGGGGTN